MFLRSLPLAALAILACYLLYRSELKLYPMERITETTVPLAEEAAKELVRECEASAGSILDADLSQELPDDPYVSLIKWRVSDENDGAKVQCIRTLRPVNIWLWLKWKATAEFKYRKIAREKVLRVKMAGRKSG